MRDGELKLEKYSVSDTDVLLVPARLIVAVLVGCLAMQVLGCRYGEESGSTNVESKLTVEQQQAFAMAETGQQLVDAQTLLEQGNADQAWEFVNQILLMTPTDVNALG